MLVHTVIFWLRKDLTAEQRQFFAEKIQLLEKIKSCEAVYIGIPAATEKRPVIDTSYDFCLTCIFKGLKEQDQYQVDPLHTEFLKHCKSLWERVLIYDAE